MIEAEYRDVWGRPHRAPAGTVERLATALESLPDRTGEAVPPPQRLRCFAPRWMEDGGRAWGIAIQLYGLRSDANWGIGDFGDLQRLALLAGAEGADFIAVNPLHALFAGDPGRFSPYAPASREFINVLYLDVPAIDGFGETDAAQRNVAAPTFAALLQELRARDTVDYRRVAAAKDLICRMLFAAFEERYARAPDEPAAQAFAQFCTERGEALQRFALYQALALQPRFGSDWTQWPAAFRDPDGDAVHAFAAARVEEIRYHAFLQWQADLQLAACAAAARAAGMRIGLYLDLALGAPAESAEGWVAQRSMIGGFHVGAPPDQWNELGQDWGLFAYNPRSIATVDDFPFRRVLRANMRHAGTLRLDHVLGLNRLFLMPKEGRPVDGAYLRYPADQLCAAIATESETYRTIIVGEDLGTIPEGLQDLLAGYGLLSYRLLIFSRDEAGRLLPPHAFPRQALIALSTHDLPTLAGLWSGHDLHVRATLDLYRDAAAKQQATDERQSLRAAVLDGLREAGLPVADDLPTLAVAIHAYMARTPAALMVVQLEDLALEKDQANLPGTHDTHPNWQRKLRRNLEDLFRAPQTRAVLAAVRAERPRDIAPP